MVTLVKLGGSLITDKNQRATLRPDILKRLAEEIRSALDVKSGLSLIIGHGSGSFGHFEAKTYNTVQGVHTVEEWAGFASVSRIAAELNFHVASVLGNARIPIFRVQPSASAITQQGVIQEMAISTIKRALENGIVPLVYGDVAFDDAIGGTIISTESVFRYLANQLPVERILLLGEVDGAYDESGKIIADISPDNFDSIKSALGGSDGVDVTGGMLTKVQDMLNLANQAPYPDVTILNGAVENRLRDALIGKNVIGTRISQ